jgi:ssRNA-specific RNase YbeY (16S rRNA maturation enzyme)
MTRKNENRVKELLIELAEIAKKEKTMMSIYIKDDAHISINNDHWDRDSGGFDFFSTDRGKTWIRIV